MISVQVISKSGGKYKLVKTIGSSIEPVEIVQLVAEGKAWIKSQEANAELDLYGHAAAVEAMLRSVDTVQMAGFELVGGTVFDAIGFNQIKDPLFR